MGCHLGNRLCVRRLSLLYLHNVITKLALYNRDVADLLREDRIVKLRHHLSALRKPQLAAGGFAAWVVGIFLCQVGPSFPPAFQLLQNVLSLGLRRGIGFGVGVWRHGDENVARTGLLGNLVVRLVLRVVGLDLSLSGLRNAAGNLIGSEGRST